MLSGRSSTLRDILNREPPGAYALLAPAQVQRCRCPGSGTGELRPYLELRIRGLAFARRLEGPALPHRHESVAFARAHGQVPQRGWAIVHRRFRAGLGRAVAGTGSRRPAGTADRAPGDPGHEPQMPEGVPAEQNPSENVSGDCRDLRDKCEDGRKIHLPGARHPASGIRGSDMSRVYEDMGGIMRSEEHTSELQ